MQTNDLIELFEIELFTDRTVWHLNLGQINDFCSIESFEIKLFTDLTVCKQMTDV